MSKESELLWLEGLGGLFGGRHRPFVPEPGQACRNCEAVLQGPYCHMCSQSATNHHRHVLHMVWDSVEGLFHLDGRLWRTLPALFFRPGALARDYIEGRLARHVPPFRTFLVAVLVFFFVSENLIHHIAREAGHGAQGVTTADGRPIVFSADAPPRAAGSDGAAGQKTTPLRISIRSYDRAFAGRLNAQAAYALHNPDAFVLTLFGWAHRMALLLLPIMTAILAAMYVYRRDIFVFDHFLVACNLMSFIFLSGSVALSLPDAARPVAFAILAVWTPINIFLTLRGAYLSGIAGAAIRTAILCLATVVSFAIVLAVTLVVSVAAFD